MNSNIYCFLENTNVLPIGKNGKRKYNKKMREISRLKQKKTISIDESEKIKKETEYKKIVGAYVAPTIDHTTIMNKLPDDVLFIILSYLPFNIRLTCLKPLYNKYFVNNTAFVNTSELIKMHHKIEPHNVNILRKIAIYSVNVKNIYSPDEDKDFIAMNIKDDIGKKDAKKYYYYYIHKYCNMIVDVCKKYTAIYNSLKKYTAKEVAICEANIFQIYLKIAVLCKNKSNSSC